MPPADPGRRLAAGDRLLQYEVLELLGAGGMGEVYRARDVRLDREVAVKVLPARVADDPAVQARFEREARAVATLSHPGIVTIYEFARAGDRQLVAMELLRGETLRQRLDRERLPWADAVQLAAQMADALAAAHDAALVHRDLKPENAFLTRSGAVKILDFGLATGRPGGAAATASIAETLSRGSGALGFAGTLGYSAPEQLRGEPVDGRADLFALGCILYELLAGRRAFTGATPADVAASVLAREPAPLVAVGADVPPGLEGLVFRCLRKQPADRLDTARALAARLREVSRVPAGAASGARAPSGPRPPSTTHFDLLVVGSGPAGQRGAIAAAKAGKRVVVVDRRAMIGGASLHRATIPSKTLRELVAHLAGLQQRPFFGRELGAGDGSFPELAWQVRRVIEREQLVIEGQLARNGVTLADGRARLAGPHEVVVTNDHHDYVLTADHLLVATGSSAAPAPHLVPDGQRVFDTDALPALDQIPRELVVVGASVIGLEYASMVAALNRRVTIVDQRPVVMEFADTEIVEALFYQLRRRGAVFRLGDQVTGVGRDGRDQVVATLASGRSVHGDVLVSAVGRQANTRDLGLEHVGLTTDERGRLQVNADFQTAVPHIYAAGDVVGFPALASTSMEQGRRAVAHMFGLPGARVEAPLPYGIYTIPEISMVGRTEQQLTAAGVRYEVGAARYEDLAKGQMIGDDAGFLKVLFDPGTLRVLGVHILGSGAAELIHVAQSLMAAGGTLDVWRDAAFNHPTLAEAYKVAALNGFNRLGDAVDRQDARPAAGHGPPAAAASSSLRGGGA
ncbi:MAG: Si-specific NAD(P)(+) transhydrogenase [Vicinamibacterales bacterium]